MYSNTRYTYMIKLVEAFASLLWSNQQLSVLCDSYTVYLSRQLLFMITDIEFESIYKR